MFHFDGFSLTVFLLLAFVIPLGVAQLILTLREMVAIRRLGRKLDEMESTFDAMEADEFLGSRPW